MKLTQKDTNPFKYTDSNKRYHTYDYYMRKKFGGKCVKIPIDCGFTCPNIDGKCGVGGCIYCSSRGSGDFAESPLLPVAEQYRRERESYSSKWETMRCIPYLQAHTNTYADIGTLRRIYTETLALPDAVGMSIATRADCLPDDVTELLCEVAEKTNLTVELGLQSSNDKTAALINRGHSFEDFVRGYEKLRRASDKISICVHIINGLPGEDGDMMMQTVRDILPLAPDQIKFHLMHVLRETELCRMYLQGEYTPLTLERYVDIIIRQLMIIPPKTVVGRITGDGARDLLVAPLWSLKKFVVMNEIDKRLQRENKWQGMSISD